MKWLRPIGLGALGLVIMAAAWELYKAVGPEAGALLMQALVGGYVPRNP